MLWLARDVVQDSLLSWQKPKPKSKLQLAGDRHLGQLQLLQVKLFELVNIVP